MDVLGEFMINPRDERKLDSIVNSGEYCADEMRENSSGWK